MTFVLPPFYIFGRLANLIIQVESVSCPEMARSFADRD